MTNLEGDEPTVENIRHHLDLLNNLFLELFHMEEPTQQKSQQLKREFFATREHLVERDRDALVELVIGSFIVLNELQFPPAVEPCEYTHDVIEAYERSLAELN